MKICNKCHIEKPLSEFHRRKDGVQPYCKSCKKQDDANYRLQNIDYFRNRAKKQRLDLRLMVQSLKDQPCADCKKRFHFSAMDFDHTNDNKESTIAALVGSGSKQKLLNEIDKCEIVCSNCHRVRTWSRLQD